MAHAASDHRLQSNCVHVWRTGLRVPGEQFAMLAALLSGDERVRAGRFRFQEDRRRYIVGRGCLRLLLASYLGEGAGGLRITYGDAGKPQLEDGGLQFNLSHSGEWGLLAISKEMVGIDLERIRGLDYEGVGRAVFSDGEMALVCGAGEAEKGDVFFRLWVRREARLKALGVGMTQRLCPEMPVYDVAALPGFCAAVATPLVDPAIELLDFTSPLHPGI